MNQKLILGAVIAVVVVAGPLWLKRQQAQSTQTNPAVIAPTAKPVAAPVTRPLPRFVDVGTTSCAPCKAMMVVLGELEVRYADALRVEFINSHDNPDAAETLGIRAIPTQLFFAPDGRELYRHTGVIRSEAVVAKWAELGYPLVAKAAP